MFKLLMSLWMGGLFPILMSSASLPGSPDRASAYRASFRRDWLGADLASSRERLTPEPAAGAAAFWPLLQARLVRPELAAAPKLRPDVYDLPFKTVGLPRISSAFGVRLHPKFRRQARRKGWEFHKGWDLPQRRGTPVYPSRSGRVVFAGWRAGYGQMVEVQHSGGLSSIYGHLGRIAVKKGETALAGETVLGKVGSTGRSTGAHLHFELRDAEGRPLDPALELGRR